MSSNLHLEGRGAPSLYQTPTEVTETIRRLAERECRGLAHDLAALAAYRMWLHRQPFVAAKVADAHVAECVTWVRAAGSGDSLVTYW